MAYAWTNETDDPESLKHHVTLLHLGLIKSAADAVRAAIVQEFRNLEATQEEAEQGRTASAPQGKRKGRRPARACHTGRTMDNQDGSEGQQPNRVAMDTQQA